MKKAYDGKSMECKICSKKGHTDSFCPEPTHDERSAFADNLIAMPRDDVHTRYENKDIPSVMVALEQRGAELI